MRKQPLLMAKYKINVSLNNIETKGEEHLNSFFPDWSTGSDHSDHKIQIYCFKKWKCRVIFFRKGSFGYSDLEMLSYSELLMDMIWCPYFKEKLPDPSMNFSSITVMHI